MSKAIVLKNANQPKPQQKKRQRQRNRGPRLRQANVDVWATDFINPWSTREAKKIPDADSSMSFTIRLRTVGTVGSNAGTTTAGTLRQETFFVNPNLAYYPAPVYTDNGGEDEFPMTSLGASSSMTGYTELAAASEAYRVAAAGVRFTTVGKPLDCSGWMTLITNSNASSSPAKTATAPDDYSTRKTVVPVQNGLQVVWLAQPNDNDAWTYRDINSSSHDPFGWTSLSVFVEGTTSDTVIRFEYVMDLECLPKTSSLFTRLATEAAAYNVNLMQAMANRFRSVDPVAMLDQAASSLQSGGFLHRLYHSNVGQRALGALAAGGFVQAGNAMRAGVMGNGPRLIQYQ